MNESENKLLSKIPSDGTSIGNVTLRKSLKWQELEYLNVRKGLLDSGVISLGKGKGGSVSRNNDVLENLFLAEIPPDSKSIGNKALQNKLQWSEPVYRHVKNRLVDSGVINLGKGRGGSVARLVGTDFVIADRNTLTANGKTDSSDSYPTEKDLYEEVRRVIDERWVKEKNFSEQYFVEITAQGGGAKTGIWSRPDVTVVAKTIYKFVPLSDLDVITFEIKHSGVDIDVTAVYEALSHKKSATQSYLLIYVPENKQKSADTKLAEITEEASRHGIGVIIVGNPKVFDSWDIKIEAERIMPDPVMLDNFIARQISTAKQEKILGWFK